MDQRTNPKTRYRGKPIWSHDHRGLRLDHWRGRFHMIEEYGDENYRQRSHHYRITADDGRVVATGEMTEWQSKADEPLNTFADVCDALDSETDEMGSALFSAFIEAEDDSQLNPLNYGSLLVLDRLVIKATSAVESDAVWVLINAMIGQCLHADRPEISGVLLKAFPLDGDGLNTRPGHQVDADKTHRHVFDRRRRALKRLYRQRLDVKDLPGWPGDNGWQWKPFWCELEPTSSDRQPTGLGDYR